MKSACVIVDAYSSGNLLQPEFREKGCDCVHVQSSKEIPGDFAATFRPTDFIDNLIFAGDADELVSALKKYDPSCVVPGTETGVPLADTLSEKLGLKGNGTKLSLARRDKFRMHRVLRENGIASISQIQADVLDEASSWVEKVTDWPVVAKPTHSAGTDNVFVCESVDDLSFAFKSILERVNQLGLKNEHVLVQEYLKGTEYIVDTVSAYGQHYVTDFYKYHKKSINGRHFVYDAEEFLPPQGELQDKLEAYAFSVLDALEIKFGPAHSEVMMTSRGPVLIEMGARLNGGGAPILIGECTGVSPAKSVADAYLSSDYITNLSGKRYERVKSGIYVYLISNEEGELLSLPMLDRIKELPSFYRMQIDVKSGDYLKKTVDLFSYPGHVELSHEDYDTVMADYRAIRRMEEEGFYQLK